MDEQIKIMIVDDHEIFRSGLKMVINKLKFAKVVSEASNGKECLSILSENNLPDIVLMDIQMPEMNGIEATRAALEMYPNLKIVALTMFNEDEYVESMIDAGVKGFILKNITKEIFEKALLAINKGNNYYSEELWSFFTKRLTHEDKPSLGEDLKLTRREVEILNLLLEGLSNKEIADRLFVSERTIIGHKSNLLSKTGCKSTVHLLAYAIKNKLIEVN
ncbi:MAG: hypothetical protein A2275_16595 [Bacteroidetes bacterium RIFOXYA12_FULL_35_11]|nr:MAG: hypothetical protein A2X01_11910 [Bacteroidetes bacterium GWF2_35_48]OFY72374.1 MAG: hypothetical protein A2275_16595 [Bacteroidetes bacterium RIFOXYA12_FULL_35_11]HBX49530.1 DNA-binding response regulator [Bacteroidales bacterium]